MPDEPIRLRLTNWQKRMLKDMLKLEPKAKVPSEMALSRVPRKEWVMYRVPPLEALNVGAFNFYLSDAQIKNVKAALNLKAEISALVISPEMLKTGAVKLV